MPTYDYRCEECGAEFEVFHGMTENPAVKCEKCGSADTKRLLAGGSGLIFKGSGFYITDYNKSNSNGAGSAAAAKESKSGDNGKEAGESSTPKESPRSESKAAENKPTPAPSKSET